MGDEARLQPGGAIFMNTVIPPRGLAGYAWLLRRNRDMRMLWSGQLVSYIGDWFNSIALLGLMIELTRSNLIGSLIFLCAVLPGAIAGLFISGVVADKFDRKKVMIAADLIRALIALSFLLVRSSTTAWIGLVGTAALSFVSSFFQPAAAAAAPNLTSAEELPLANALGQSTFASTTVIGSLIGGAAAALFGRDVSFILNSASFLLSAFFISQVAARFNKVAVREQLSRGGALRALVEGFVYARDHRITLTYMLAKLPWAFAQGAIGLYAVYSLQIYGMGDVGTSWLYASRGAGGLLGPLLVSSFIPLNDTPRLARVLRAALVLAISGHVLLGATGWIGFGMVGLFSAYLGGACVWVFSTLILQSTTPDAVRGRVLSLDGVSMSLTMSVASLFAGLVAVSSGPQWGVLACAAIATMGGFVWYFVFARKAEAIPRRAA